MIAWYNLTENENICLLQSKTDDCGALLAFMIFVTFSNICDVYQLGNTGPFYQYGFILMVAGLDKAAGLSNQM